MKKYAFLLLVIFGASLGLTKLGFGGLPFERDWTASGALGSADSSFAWLSNYHFSAGGYEMTGYPPISENGSYSVVLHEQDDYSDDYTLVMTPSSGDPAPSSPYLIQLRIYEDGSMSMGSLSSGATQVYR